MSEDDFDDILKLEKYSFNERDGMNTGDLREYLRDHGDGFYRITAGGRFAGYILFFAEGGCGYMESIAVDGKLRRQGIAGAAVKFMVERLRQRGVNCIRLHVRGENAAAIALYEKHGFIRSGVDADFYGTGVDASVYTLHLQ